MLGSRTIPVRMRDDDIRQVDLLVELGVFNSRGEGLRELIRLGVKNLSDVAEIAAALERLSELEDKEGDIPVRLRGAVEQLLSERGRFS